MSKASKLAQLFYTLSYDSYSAQPQQRSSSSLFAILQYTAVNSCSTLAKDSSTLAKDSCSLLHYHRQEQLPTAALPSSPRTAGDSSCSILLVWTQLCWQPDPQRMWRPSLSSSRTTKDTKMDYKVLKYLCNK